MVTRRTESHTANILIKMEGEGDWAAKKEKINGLETIVFFRREVTSSPLQTLRDKLDGVMSGTAAANKYLKKMQINQRHKILDSLHDPNKNKISKESLISYIQNLHSIAKINEKLSSGIENISRTEKFENNFVSVCEIISFKDSEESVKALNLISSLIENKSNSDLDSVDKKKTLDALKAKPQAKNNNETLISSDEQKNIIRHVNFALDNSYQNKSIKEQNEHKKKCIEAYTFLQEIKLPESSTQKGELDKLINKLKIVANTKPSTNPAILKMKQEIASNFLKDFGEDLSETKTVEIIKYIDIAVDPISYKPTDNKNKEFKVLCSNARLNLINFGIRWEQEQPSHLQKKIYQLIRNLDLVTQEDEFYTAKKEIQKPIDHLTDFLKSQLKNKSDTDLIKNINSSVKTAFYDFYEIETKENARGSIKDTLQRLGDANQTLWFLRELARPNTSTDASAKEAVATLDKLIEHLNNKIDKLKRER
jgi:hypothetical protein